MNKASGLKKSFAPAQEYYAALGVDVSRAPLIRTAEAAGDFTTRLALQEEAKSLPFGAVWDFYCEQNGVPVGDAWLMEVKSYEKNVLSKRI